LVLAIQNLEGSIAGFMAQLWTVECIIDIFRRPADFPNQSETINRVIADFQRSNVLQN